MSSEFASSVGLSRCCWVRAPGLCEPLGLRIFWGSSLREVCRILPFCSASLTPPRGRVAWGPLCGPSAQCWSCPTYRKSPPDAGPNDLPPQPLPLQYLDSDRIGSPYWVEPLPFRRITVSTPSPPLPPPPDSCLSSLQPYIFCECTVHCA